MFIFITLLTTTFIAQNNTNYYVAISGSDTGRCGAKTEPCASINQVVTNYPGTSFTMMIDAETHKLNQITIQSDSVVIFQGAGDTRIEAKWDSDSFQAVVLLDTSGFEFRDLALFLLGDGSTFSILSGVGNNGGFYNIALTYIGYEGMFVDVEAGELCINNLTFIATAFDSFFIHAVSKGDSTNISIIGSNFSDLNIHENGAFLHFSALGPANILLDSSNFNGIRTGYEFFAFGVEDPNQTITVTNNVFTDTLADSSAIDIRNYYPCLINVQNTSWTNATADFLCAALLTVGYDDGRNSVITLNNLTFVSCHGIYAGALFVYNNSFTLSNSTFANNSANFSGNVGNDIIWKEKPYYSSLDFTITNCFSSSPRPKFGVMINAPGETSIDMMLDMSNLLPDPMQLDARDRKNKETVQK